MQPFSFFFVGFLDLDFGSGSGSKFNCQTISGTGQVRASVLSPCRPLVLDGLSVSAVSLLHHKEAVRDCL